MQTLSFSSPKLSTKTVVSLALFVALSLVLKRFTFGTNFLQLSPVFIAAILMAYYLGPWVGAVGAIIVDQLNVLVFFPGLDFPGFTVTAALTAVIYGVFLYQKPIKLWRVVAAVLLVTVIGDIVLNTIWIDMMGTPWQGIIWLRLAKSALMLPIQVAVGFAALKAVARTRLKI
ncbi:folate family ECF transporter S component [Lacticaseibacillus baoqingensis]|uniref:Folate family ECF transporter S component n=1 Tax=Lacticaseibacillus baoqingensis TaxID=2486013 RepID=A0ABW4E7T4_9LACO|nr:folate family ECF transporter S component [Lacticaseibacillus baoqingensis]